MVYQFQRHYTRDEARRLLPQVRRWLGQLRDLRETLGPLERRINRIIETGLDAGGQPVNDWARAMAGVKAVLAEFRRREIQVKDLDRGLIDFPALIAGREVFLCWEQDEEDIEFWHDLASGYGGRERL